MDREGIYTWLRIADQVKYVHLRFPIAFIIGDGKSGDQICQRYAGYTDIPRLSRTCKVSSDKADSPSHVCDFLTANEIDSLVYIATSEPESLLLANELHDKKKLKEKKEEIKAAQAELAMLSAHLVLNAFHNVNFGGDEFRIYGATPTNLMHAFQSGLIPYLVKMAVDPLSPKNKKLLDDLVDHLLGGLHSSEKDQYPRFNFSHGFTNLTMITSDEWPGMLFALLLVLQTEDGVDIMSSVFTAEEDIDLDEDDLYGQIDDQVIANLEAIAQKNSAKTDDGDGDADDNISEDSNMTSEEEAINRCSVADFIHLAEALLSFHAWYKLGSPYNWSAAPGQELPEQRILLGIRKLLAMVCIDRKSVV